MAAVLSLAAALLAATPATAAGLYFSERGVRPLGRGGAFAAGADDLGAIWYNPAGVYDAGSQFLFDVSWLNFTTDYTREQLLRQRDPNTGQVVAEYVQTFPSVEGTTPVIPIPTFAVSYQVADEWVLALGVEAPYAAIPSYPETLDGKPSPSRYSLITMDGSLLGVVGAWAGWAPSEQWRLGAGLQLLVGKFVTTTMFSACVPDRFFCAYEQPEWDTLVQLTAGPIVAPSGNLGVKWIPRRDWRIGAAFQLPFWVRSDAEATVRLPSTPAFERASVEGSDASVSFELPWSLRLGVEYRPIEPLALELDGSLEGWAMHDEIVVVPEDVVLRGIPGFPDPLTDAEQHIARNFQNTYSVRFGAELGQEVADGVDLGIRAGASYESSAIPPEYMSVLTVDVPKLTLALGASLTIARWRFDMVFAHVFGWDVTVDPKDAKSPLLSPIEANLAEPHHVNGGTYSARANVVGLGLRYSFGDGHDRKATEHGDGDGDGGGTAASSAGASADGEAADEDAVPSAGSGGGRPASEP